MTFPRRRRRSRDADGRLRGSEPHVVTRTVKPKVKRLMRPRALFDAADRERDGAPCQRSHAKIIRRVDWAKACGFARRLGAHAAGSGCVHVGGYHVLIAAADRLLKKNDGARPRHHPEPAKTLETPQTELRHLPAANASSVPMPSHNGTAPSPFDEQMWFVAPTRMLCCISRRLQMKSSRKRE